MSFFIKKQIKLSTVTAWTTMIQGIVIEVINKLSVNLSIDTCTRSFEDDMQSRRPNRPGSFICKDICLLCTQTDRVLVSISDCITLPAYMIQGRRLKVPLAYFYTTVHIMVWSCPSVRVFCIFFFLQVCFEVLSWNFVYGFVVMCHRSSSCFIRFGQFLNELCLVIDNRKFLEIDNRK